MPETGQSKQIHSKIAAPKSTSILGQGVFLGLVFCLYQLSKDYIEQTIV